MKFVIGYAGVGLAFFALDFVWLSLMVPRLYRPLLEPMLAPSLAVAPAAAFYLIYVAAIVWLAVLPAVAAGSWTHAATSGFVFGFAAYATYNLTNQATLKVWPTTIVLADVGWGAVATMCAAVAGYAAIRLIPHG